MLIPLTTVAICFDNLGQTTLLIHGVRVEIHLVLKKLRVVAQSLKVVRQETPSAGNVFVGLADIRARLFLWQNR
jgi:hypothetical protein